MAGTDTVIPEGLDIEAIAKAISDGMDEKVKKQFDDLEDQLAANIEATIEKMGLAKAGEAPGGPDPEDLDTSKFERFGEFLTAVKRTERGLFDERLRVLGEGENDTGGALVPEAFRAQLLQHALQDATIRPRAFSISMPTQSIRIPALRDTTHASNVFGGVAGYWTEESGTITESAPTFAQVGLTAKKLAFYTSASNELLRDSAIALEQLLLRLFGEAIRWFEEKAFIRGTGVGEPLGILNSSALVSVAKETGQDANTVLVDNLDKMYARQLNPGRSVWMANRDVLPQLFALSRVVGTGGSPVFQTNIQGSPSLIIHGQPVVLNEHMSTLGTTGDIVFVDWSYYLIGDRQGLEMASSPHVRFQQDETVWRGTERLDGRPWLDTALTPAQSSDTLSPIVTLATRA